jgi:hypothetical protein
LVKEEEEEEEKRRMRRKSLDCDESEMAVLIWLRTASDPEA